MSWYFPTRSTMLLRYPGCFVLRMAKRPQGMQWGRKQSLWTCKHRSRPLGFQRALGGARAGRRGVISLWKLSWLVANSHWGSELIGSSEPRSQAACNLPPLNQGGGSTRLSGCVCFLVHQCQFVQTDWLSSQRPSCHLYRLQETYG